MQANPTLPKPEITTASPGATDTSVKATVIIQTTRWSTPDSVAPSPASGRSQFKRNNPGLSSLDRILNRPCQIHGTPDKPANHTNISCWVFKQAVKINAENKEKGAQSEDD